MDQQFFQYWSNTMTLVGEIPAERVAAKLTRDFPDLSDRAALAAYFAFNVKAGLQGLDDDDPEAAHLEHAKMMALLDVIFFMLGGTQTGETE